MMTYEAAHVQKAVNDEVMSLSLYLKIWDTCRC